MCWIKLNMLSIWPAFPAESEAFVPGAVAVLGGKAIPIYGSAGAGAGVRAWTTPTSDKGRVSCKQRHNKPRPQKRMYKIRVELLLVVDGKLWCVGERKKNHIAHLRFAYGRTNCWQVEVSCGRGDAYIFIEQGASWIIISAR